LIVRRLVVADHPLLCAAAAYLETLAPPPPPYQARGDLAADVLLGAPTTNRNRPHAFNHRSVPPPRPPELPGDTVISAIEYYPEGGGLGWHTDSGWPGWRIYIPRPLGAPGTFYTRLGRFQDAPGIANAFYVSGRPGESWHAVLAGGPRFSIGLRIVDPHAATACALGLA
jgi:hypothetical protein